MFSQFDYKYSSLPFTSDKTSLEAMSRWCHDQPIETWLDKISTVPFHTFLLLHYKRKAFWLVDIFFNKFSYQSLSDVRGGSWLVDIVLISFLISLCQCEGVFLIGWYSFNKFSYQFLSDVRGCSWLVDIFLISFHVSLCQMLEGV